MVKYPYFFAIKPGAFELFELAELIKEETNGN